MWGTGSNDQNTIPSLFSKLNNVNAINYAESGYSSIQSLNYLNTLIIKEDLSLKNKLVVFYDGVNNVTDNCLSSNKKLETARELQIGQFINQPKVTNFSYYIKPLLFVYDSITKFQNKNKFVNQDFRDCDNDILKADLLLII